MYTLQQQVFTLSFLSNAAFNHTGSPAVLQTGATSLIDSMLSNATVIAQIGSSWHIVWGPIVFQAPSSDAADNMMVVYQGTSGGSPVYVVGIAATNGLSQFDVQEEDLDVGSTVPFGSNGAWISTGTSTGVQKLEAMTDPAGGSLQSFLASKAASNATLIFAGHSLGGALSPTLALDLAVNHGFALTKWANVFVYPSAGHTPGNQKFSALFAQTFRQQPGGEAWNAWNMDVVNSIDVVPRAWSQLQTLPTLYPLLLSEAPGVLKIVTKLTREDHLHTTNVYAILPTSSFGGRFNPSPPSAPPPGGALATVPKFYEQAYYQHIRVYLETIVPELVPLLAPGTGS